MNSSTDSPAFFIWSQSRPGPSSRCWLWFLGIYGWFLWVSFAAGVFALTLRGSSASAPISAEVVSATAQADAAS